MTTDEKHKINDLRSAYTFNTQDDESEMFFVIVKMVQPSTHAGFSDIKSNLWNINMSKFKDDTPKDNLYISE